MVLAGSLWYVWHRMQGLDGGAVLAGLGQLSQAQVVIALLAVATAFVAVAGQERAIVAHLGLNLPQGRAGRAAAAAVAQTVGFGPVVGTLVRRRLLAEVTLGQSFAISAGMTLGFFAGLAVLTLASFAVLPGMPQRALAQAVLALVLAGFAALALTRAPYVLGLRKPNLFIVGRFLFWLSVDLAAPATALWAVLPVQDAPGFWLLLPVFLVALGLGTASGSPGGIGPFEATLLAGLPQVEEAGLLAAILAFRALAYAVPALCGALWALTRPGQAVVSAPDDVTEVQRLSPDALHALPWAEAQVMRQGSLTLLHGPGAGEPRPGEPRPGGPEPGGWRWLSGKLAHTRVMLGPVMLGPVMAGVRCPEVLGPEVLGPEVMGPEGLARVERLARAEARLLCLYKIDGRMAVLARACGYAVLPVAREAVLDPQGFHLAVPERARLRRKLAHARKAGIIVEDCATPPLAEMAVVAAAWQAAHGRERGFSMGRWERSYAAGQRVITARAPGGALLAFITFHAGDAHWALDLVRVKPGAPDGTIYAMISHALEMARWLGVRELSLAAVPEAAFGLTGPWAALVQRATRGSVGLAQFKSAFAPAWRRLYIAAPSRLALLIGGLDVARAILRPAPLAKGRRVCWTAPRPGAVVLAAEQAA